MDNDRVAHDVPRRNFQQVLERWKRLKAKSNLVRKKRDAGEGSFVTNDCIGQHEIK